MRLSDKKIDKLYFNNKKIRKMFHGDELIHYDVTSGLDINPKLSNFHITDENKDRVYFDSSETILGMTTTGFTISDKTISGVTISDTNVGHYFTVLTGFTFWDNNTIRLDTNNIVFEFTLTYIQNNISEPTNAVVDYRYVTSGATGGGDGSEGSPWTWDEARTSATSGMTVWVKAGQYDIGAGFQFQNDGTSTTPVKFIGYKNTIGDLDGVNYFTYGTSSIDSSEMPLLDGISGTTNRVMRIESHYFIMKNIQVQNHSWGFNIWGPTGEASNAVIDNCIAHATIIGNTGSGFFGEEVDNIRFTNSLAINGGGVGFSMTGEYGLIDNCKAYSDIVDGATYSSTDYYLFIGGKGNSIVRNSEVERFDNATHDGHGISMKGTLGNGNEYNLVENCTIIGIKKALEFSYADTKYCVARNIYFESKVGLPSDDGGAIVFREGTSYNIVENSYAKDVTMGIMWQDTSEDGEQAGGLYNKVINSIFTNSLVVFSSYGTVATPVNQYNEILNCTFYNTTDIFEKDAESTFDNTNLSLLSLEYDD